MALFSDVFLGLGGPFFFGVAELSAFGWRLMPGGSFGVSSPYFDGGVF